MRNLRRQPCVLRSIGMLGPLYRHRRYVLCLVWIGLVPLAHADRAAQRTSHLQDPNPIIRLTALKALGTSRSSRALEELIAALNDPNLQVRQTAAETLGQRRDPRAVEPLVAALHQPFAVACAASASQNIVTALTQIGWAGAPLLLNAFSDSRDTVSSLAIGKALGGISDPRITDRLVEMTGSNPDRHARERALEVLALRKDSRSIPALLAILKAPSQASPPGSVPTRGGPNAFRNAISDPTTGQRTRSIHALGTIDTPEATAAIAGVITSPNEIVRQVALREVTEHRHLTLAILTPALESRNTDVRNDAFHALSSIHDPQIMPYLRTALHSQEERLRLAAVAALRGMLAPTADSEVLGLVLSAEKDSSSRVRVAALRALGSVNSPVAFAAIMVALHDPSADARSAAVIDLAQMTESEVQPEIVPAILQAVQDSSAIVRVQALHALIQRKAPQALSCLIEALKDADPAVRWPAADELAKLGDPAAIGPLAQALQVEREPGVREHVVRALSHFPNPQAIDPLVALLERTDSRDDLSRIPRTLGDSKNPFATEGLIRLLQSSRPAMREAGAHGLAEMQASVPASAIPPILLALRDNDVEVRREAARALVNATGEQVVQPLIDALQDTDWYVRFSATLGLVHTRDLRAIHAIVATFANTDINDANSGPQYLAESGGPDALAAVVAALEDPNPHVRLVAAHAMRYTNDATTFPALIRAENDPEPTVREAAKLALSGCPRPIPN